MPTRKLISKMFYVLLIVMVLLPGFLPVQAESLASPLLAIGDFLWAKGMGGTSDDYGYSIAIDSNGNVYTTGTSNNFASARISFVFPSATITPSSITIVRGK